MKKVIFLLSLLFVVIKASAQVISVVEPLRGIKDTYATVHPIKDVDGKICAVIKIGLKLDDVRFLGDSVIHQQKGDGSEYIVYVIPGCKKVTVQADPLLPYEYVFPTEIAPANTYRLLLDVIDSDVKVIKHIKKTNDNYAMSHRVDDIQGNPCAVIRVGIKLPDVKFEGGFVKKQEKSNGAEYIVYAAAGCKKMTLLASTILPFEYNFPINEFPKGLSAGTTYSMELDIPKMIESVVRIRTNAKDAKLEIAGQIYEPTEPGLFEIKIPKGEYNYKITTGLPGFKNAEGTFTVNELIERKQIELITEKKFLLNIQADDKSKIVIDGKELKHRGSSSIDLAAGLHTVQAIIESDGQIWRKRPVEVDLTTGNASVDMTMRGNLRIVYPTNAKFEIIPQSGAIIPGQKYISSGEPISLLGNYTIKVTKKNYLDAMARVQVNVDENIDNFKIDVTSKADNYFYGINGQKHDFRKAFKEYEKMASKGDEIAQYKAAECLFKGLGTAKNIEKALRYYNQASNAGISDASYALGDYFLSIKNNEAGKYFMRAADQGHLPAACLAGLICKGNKDYNNALKYFLMGKEKGAKKDNSKNNKYRVECLEQIGDLYFNGLGVTKNLTKAKEWFNEAASLGSTTAYERLVDYVYLGYNGKPDKTSAVNAYMQIKDKISDKACIRVALYQFEKQQYETANEYFMRVKGTNVAMPGDIGEIFYTMGNEMYDKDKYASFYYYSVASVKGIKKPLLFFRLGYMYLKGNGTGINHALAKEFFEKAANLNDDEGIFFLGYMYDKGYGCSINKETAIKLYERAGKKGYKKAYLNLGVIYANRKDMNSAVKYWEIAGKDGNQTAISNLVKYYKSKKDTKKEQYWRSKMK